MRRATEKAALFESLESRQMMSATVAHLGAERVHAPAASHAPLHVKPQAKHVEHAKQVHASTVTPTPAPAPLAWNDLAGTWTGTFTVNGKGGATGPLSAVFQPRWDQSNTGTYNLSGMVGQSGLLTTVTPDPMGNALVYISLKNGGSVSFVGALSYGSKIMTGRWCSFVGTTYTTGIFTMTRP